MRDVKEFLHLYLGCQCFVHIDDDEEMILHGVGTDGIWINSEFYQFGDSTTNLIKPILRPLSDITQDELKEAGAISKDIIIKNDDNADSSESELWFNYTRYLLSKHFDLFNLIPEGLAIDKTKKL